MASPPVVGHKLGHYRLLEQIGSGGMGLVFRARDERLERDVAVKLLPLGTFADERARHRFRKEALALSRLNHPNIATVHDFDSQDGIDLLVTELIPGITLDAKIAAGPLAENDVIRIGLQLVEGLAAAHQHGVIHCDLKPSNLRLTPDGRLKILDFGLARMQSSPDAATESYAHSTTPAGTLPYMAPEQLRGEELSPRVDIWAVGVVLYQLATGELPFKAKTAQALAGAILHQSPRPSKLNTSQLAMGLQSIILKCLEKAPEYRYQSAKELVVDLKRLASASNRADTEPGLFPNPSTKRRWAYAGAGLLVLALVTTASIMRSRSTSAAGAPITSIAVLPLANMSADRSQEYFADGMTEAVISNLAQIRALKVTSRTSIMRYKGSTKSVPEIARELNVDAIVEGSVHREGARVLVTARLIRAATDSRLWANEYQRNLSDVLKLQTEIARAISSEVRVQLTPEERVRLANARTVNPDAYEAYLRGRFHYLRLNEPDLKIAIAEFDRAIELEPDFALAYASLSQAWQERSTWGALSLADVESQSRAAAEKALQLDDNVAEAHVSLAAIKWHWDLEWRTAEQEFQRALELDRNNLDGLIRYAFFLNALGRFADAEALMERAYGLDPNDSTVESNFGRMVYRARRYQEALEHLQRAIDLDPNNFGAYGRMADVYELMGDYPRALSFAQQAEAKRAGSGVPARYSSEIGRAQALMGQRKLALQTIAAMKANVSNGSATNIALVYAAVGDKDQAFAWLEQAVARRELVNLLPTEPKLDILRSDPRWQDFLRSINYPG